MKIMFEPMTLGNMRESGVRSLWVRCGALHCNHDTVMDVSAYVSDRAVIRPANGVHSLRCDRC